MRRNREISRYMVKGMPLLEIARTVVEDTPEAVSISLGRSTTAGVAQHSISLELRDETATPKAGTSVTISGLGRAKLSSADITALQTALGVVIDVASTYNNILFNMPYPDYVGGERVYDVVVTNNTISLYGKTLTDATDTTIEYFISPLGENETVRDGTGKDLAGLPLLNEPPWGGPSEVNTPNGLPAEIALVIWADGLAFVIGGPGLANNLEIFEYGFNTAGAMVPAPFPVIAGSWDILVDIADFFASVDPAHPLKFDPAHRAQITTSEGTDYGFNAFNSSFRQEFFKRTEDWITYLKIRKEGDSTHWYQLDFRSMDYLKRGGIAIP